MPDSKGITISGKNLGQWVAIMVIIVGSIVDSALTRSKVAEHEARFLLNPPEVAAADRDNMAEDLQEIKTDVKDLAKAINEYFQSH